MSVRVLRRPWLGGPRCKFLASVPQTFRFHPESHGDDLFVMQTNYKPEVNYESVLLAHGMRLWCEPQDRLREQLCLESLTSHVLERITRGASQVPSCPLTDSISTTWSLSIVSYFFWKNWILRLCAYVLRSCTHSSSFSFLFFWLWLLQKLKIISSQLLPPFCKNKFSISFG